MARVPGWLVTGLLTAGFTAAMLLGAGAASADTGAGGPHSRAQSQDGKPSQSIGVKTSRAGDATPAERVGLRKSPARIAAPGLRAQSQRLSLRPSSSDDRPHLGLKGDRKARFDPSGAEAAPDQSATTNDAVGAVKVERTKSIIGQRDSAITSIAPQAKRVAAATVPELPQIREQVAALGAEVRQRVTSLIGSARAPTVAAAAAPTPEPITRIREFVGRAATGLSPATDTPEAAAAPSIPVLGPAEVDYPPLVRVVGSAAFDFLAALIHVVQGPPTVPPALRDSVEVSTSTLVIAPGHEVEANWYIPITSADEPAPDRFIYLQHGFLASGPMYSYTAAYLAERTDSIVVTTTLTSNPFAAGGMWLGGDNMHKAVAQLFLDEDRQALNASLTTAALKAGRDDVALPERFVLVGHSLGGGFAPGVAGYYAEGLVNKRQNGEEAPNQLAGVVIYDAVPVSPILPNAMDRLKALEASGDPADYVPVYEIGAPPNLFNSTSNVNEELSAARPGQFVGVVLDGGVHMDSMQGGNPLIQFVAYLVAGFPKQQNPPAVQELSVGWINDMFDGNIEPATGTCKAGISCDGLYGVPGEPSFTIPTDEGTATAVIINSGPSVASTSAVSAVSAGPSLSSLPTLIGSLVFDTISRLLTVIVGPPVAPPGVVVRESALEIVDGKEVPAYWYFPEGDEPQGVIYLQHGFMAVAPMYSLTAGYLAKATNSVVVTPTLSSNPLEADGFWLNSVPAQQAVAALFIGDKAALTQSAIDAGYQDFYGSADLPTQFVLAGHSAGGGVAAGAAGFYADAVRQSGAENALAGVILLDAVPGDATVSEALAKLKELAEADPDSGYVPVYEIGAPLSIWNFPSKVNEELATARPGTFVGVVLNGGTHMDAMQGGNLLVQAVAYLIAGRIALPQNAPAVIDLAAGWINDMYADGIDPATGTCVGAGCDGIYAAPGQPMVISTACGSASGVAIPGRAHGAVVTVLAALLSHIASTEARVSS